MFLSVNKNKLFFRFLQTTVTSIILFFFGEAGPIHFNNEFHWILGKLQRYVSLLDFQILTKAIHKGFH